MGPADWLERFGLTRGILSKWADVAHFFTEAFGLSSGGPGRGHFFRFARRAFESIEGISWAEVSEIWKVGKWFSHQDEILGSLPPGMQIPRYLHVEREAGGTAFGGLGSYRYVVRVTEYQPVLGVDIDRDVYVYSPSRLSAGEAIERAQEIHERIPSPVPTPLGAAPEPPVFVGAKVVGAVYFGHLKS